MPQEKLDHIGIIALILGTPITALLVSCASPCATVQSIESAVLLEVGICTVVLQAKEHGDIPTDLKYASVGMLIAAFLPPTPRVLGFASGIGVIVAFHYHKIMNINLIAQLALYLIGGISFLR